MKKIDFNLKNYKGFKDVLPKNKDLSAECEFKEINIIYGTNGSGKSTFAEYMRNEKNAVVFNRYYIDNNIYLKESNEFKGVKMISGEKNVEGEKKVEELNKRKNIITLCIDNIEKKRIEIEELINKRSKEIFQEYKLPRMHDIDYQKALEIIDKNKDDKENLKIDYTKYTFEKESVFGEENRFVKYEHIDNPISEGVAEVLKEQFTMKEYNYVDYEWIKRGLDLVSDNKCEFCKTELSTTQLSDITAFINDKTNKAKSMLTTALNKIKNINVKTENLNINNKYFSLNIKEKLEVIDYNHYDKLISRMISKINDKINDLSLVIDEDDINDFNNSLHELNQKIDNNNKVLQASEEKLLKESSRYNEITKLLISDRIINNDKINSFIMNRSKLIEDKTGLEKKLEDIEQELTANIRELKDTSNFLSYFNNQVSKLDHHFYLEMENDNYILKSSEVVDIKLSDLSEGEKFIFAFIYFYFKYMHEYSGTEMLIVIDDPFTSLDKTNKFYIEGMLLNFGRKNTNTFDSELDKQLFVLTHHYDFFIDLISSSPNRSCAFILENKNACKTIRKTDFKVREYKLIFNDIIKFSDRPTEEDAIKIGNYIRRCIETFMKFYYDVDGVSDEEKYRKLFKTDEYDVYIIAFLKFINSHSHSFTEEFDFESIKKFSIEFKKLFQKHYTEHYNSMTQ